MDRLPRTLAAFGLGLLLTAAGCRSTRPEVPPGRAFEKDGRQRKAISFSQEDGHPVSAAASANFMPNNTGGSNLAAGIGAGASRPDPSAFGAPPASYGAPGSSGLGQPPSLGQAPSDPAAIPAALAPPDSPAPAGLPPAPELNVGPPPAASTVPNQVIQAPMDQPGVMGRPDQMPSPN